MRLLLLVAIAAAADCAAPKAVRVHPMPPQPACVVPDGDHAWINRALDAWRFTSREITAIGGVPHVKVILFSADCVLMSDSALSSPNSKAVTWSAARHDGKIALPNGSQIPAGVASFAAGEPGSTFFVMATPSVWESAGVGRGPDLERMLIAVLLHEASHVTQTEPYGPRLRALIAHHALPDSFNDNAVQERFGDEEEFAASVRRETKLFLAAAAAPDHTEARRLAQEARELMRARQSRWQVGDDAYLVEAEDIWLTFEGSGQWVAYQWLTHPAGGATPVAEALPDFARGRDWSQTEGFAVVMALDRLGGPSWKRHAFGDGAKTVLEMLDDALNTASVHGVPPTSVGPWRDA